MNYNTAAPYAAAYVLLRRGNTLAFVKRAATNWMDGYYGLPSGKVEKRESILQAAVREAKEEAGIVIAQSAVRHAFTCHRKSDDNDMKWVDVVFEVDSWEGEPYNAEPHVHSELVWIDQDNLPENVIPAVSYFLDEIKAGNRYGEYGW